MSSHLKNFAFAFASALIVSHVISFPIRIGIDSPYLSSAAWLITLVIAYNLLMVCAFAFFTFFFLKERVRIQPTKKDYFVLFAIVIAARILFEVITYMTTTSLGTYGFFPSILTFLLSFVPIYIYVRAKPNLLKSEP